MDGRGRDHKGRRAVNTIQDLAEIQADSKSRRARERLSELLGRKEED